MTTQKLFALLLLLLVVSPLAAKVGSLFPPTDAMRVEASDGEVLLSVGRFSYSSRDGEPRETYDNYLVAWEFHHQSMEYQPVIVTVVHGHAPELQQHDLNADGYPELVLSYVAGAHTHVWEVFLLKREKQKPHLPLTHIGTIGSDWGRIRVAEERSSGFKQIESWHRNWQDQHFAVIGTYAFDGTEYREVREEKIRFSCE